MVAGVAAGPVSFIVRAPEGVGTWLSRRGVQKAAAVGLGSS